MSQEVYAKPARVFSSEQRNTNVITIPVIIMILLNKLPYSFAKNNHDVHTVDFLYGFVLLQLVQ